MMEYHTDKDKIAIEINAANKGKFRFKYRKGNLSFGESFATRTKDFDEDVYLEWQIGYDAVVNDVEKGKKFTKLKNSFFVGANKKRKYLYELSELVYEAMVAKLLSLKDVKELLEEVSAYTEFIDASKIEVTEPNQIQLNNVKFNETAIQLPTLFMVDTVDGTQIEVSIQKQQYATGVQPMVYFCIPLRSFSNAKTIHNRTSQKGDTLTYIIDKSNISVLVELIKIFGMCSKAHNHDVVQILKLLLELVND